MILEHTEENRNDILLLGNIFFDDYVNENELSNIPGRYRPKSIGECKIEIYGPDEGQIPHFHITSLDKEFKCCVRIYDNHFFSHGNKYRDTLNSKQCKQLDNWMKQRNDKSLVPVTNWQMCVAYWEGANPECRYPNSKKTTKQPDYKNMSMFKDNE